MTVYAIYDTVAQESGPLFEAKNDGIALRNFENFLGKTHLVDDFRLYAVGEYDKESMVLVGYEKARLVRLGARMQDGE